MAKGMVQAHIWAFFKKKRTAMSSFHTGRQLRDSYITITYGAKIHWYISYIIHSLYGQKNWDKLRNSWIQWVIHWFQSDPLPQGYMRHSEEISEFMCHITKYNGKQQIEWCKASRHWTLEQWKHGVMNHTFLFGSLMARSGVSR